MNAFALGVVSAIVAAGAIGAGLVGTGAISGAASEPHHPAVFRLLEFARERAIARASAGVVVPADLAEAHRVRRGAGNYAAMCVQCHLAPGATTSELREGLSPQPPDLTHPTADSAPNVAARRFWVIKHGIKASAMPAWSRGGLTDDNIWDLVALLAVLPAMDAAAYRATVAASAGHVHGSVPMAPQNDSHPHGAETHHSHDKPHRH